jgi:hypothetical protein
MDKTPHHNSKAGVKIMVKVERKNKHIVHIRKKGGTLLD